MVFLLYLHELEAKKTKFDEAKETSIITFHYIRKQNLLLYRDYPHMNYYI